MPKDHPFYVNKFLGKKKMAHKKSFGIEVKPQTARPVDLAFLIKCRKMYDNGQIEEVVKLLETMANINDQTLQK